MQDSTQSKKTVLQTALSLGLIVIVSSFAIDMFLPSLPFLKVYFHTDTSSAQLSITAFFVAMGFGQLIFGPLSDKYGRKGPLYAGVVLFFIASIGCAAASSIELLLMWRLLQGFGSAAGIVISRAMVRDFYTGYCAARLMSFLMLLFSVSPLCAPLVGSLILKSTGDNWRDIFWVLTGSSLLAMCSLHFFLKESWPVERRQNMQISDTFKKYGTLLKDKKFVAQALIVAFGFTGFLCFLSASSFVLQGPQFNLSPTQFSLFFGWTSLVFFTSAQFSSVWVKHIGILRTVLLGVCFVFLFMGANVVYFSFFASETASLHNIFIYLVFCTGGAMGASWMVPTATVWALEDYGHAAGACSALMGASQSILGGLGTGVMSFLNNGYALHMVSLQWFFVILAFISTFCAVTFTRRQHAAQNPAKAP